MNHRQDADATIMSGGSLKAEKLGDGETPTDSSAAE
jgi:hypothetical protein